MLIWNVDMLKIHIHGFILKIKTMLQIVEALGVSMEERKEILDTYYSIYTDAMPF